jgi:vacuole morphology and inheritance protein 14
MNDSRLLYILESFMTLFRNDRDLLEQRGSLIIRKVCAELNCIRVYQSLARMLAAEQDIEFASLMAQALNLILLTAVELSELRYGE